MESIGHPVSKSVLEEITSKSVSQAAVYTVEKLDLNITPEDLIRGILDEASSHYYNTLRLKPYALEFIENMHRHGVKMCVATATNKLFAEAALRRNGVLDYFEFILTNDDVGKDKTEPDIYLKAAEMLSADVSDTTVFEDALHCVKTAKDAGFMVVAVNDATTDHRKNEIIGIADLYILSFEELL
jgi:HAD superfamily hydrolase (TIGR01509 family)